MDHSWQMMLEELAEPRCIMRNVSVEIIGPTVHVKLPPEARRPHRPPASDLMITDLQARQRLRVLRCSPVLRPLLLLWRRSRFIWIANMLFACSWTSVMQMRYLSNYCYHHYHQFAKVPLNRCSVSICRWHLANLSAWQIDDIFCMTCIQF